MLANTSNTRLTTNFNVSPYYDDYSESKGFYKILYKPGYAVQARELTQQQTILQKQINRFGRSIFKDGSLVLDEDENRGKFNFSRIPYVKIKDNNTSSTEVDVTDYIGKVVIGTNTSISATVIDALDGSEASGNTKTLYIAYNDGNPTLDLYVFSNNEILTSNSLPSLTTVSANATGFGSRFVINEGTVFAKEHFVYFDKQALIAERYDTPATCQIGFNIAETIVDYSDDISLLDPALEATNYAAPGADRFVLNPTLIRYDYDQVVTDPDYVQLLTIKDGVVQTRNDKSQYSSILDTLATRTYTESGDYVVSGMGIRLRENLDNGFNFGLKTVAGGGDANTLTIMIDQGEGYVRGYPVGRQNTVFITTEKSRDYSNVNGQTINSRMGNYVRVKEFTGPWVHDQAIDVFLYDTAQQRISTKKASGAAINGKPIGIAKLKTIEWSANTAGTANGTFDMYLFDVKMNGSNSFSNVRSVYSNNEATAAYADVVLNNSGYALLNETVMGTLMWPVGSVATKTIRSPDGSVDTSFEFKKTDNSITTTGTFTLTVPGTGETLPYSAGVLTSGEETEFTVSINSGANITLPGLVTVQANSTQLVGTGTYFTRLNVGDKIRFANADGPGGFFMVTSIANNNYMNVDANVAILAAVTSNVINKSYFAGDIVDMTGVGVDAGAARTITINSGTSASFDLKETFGTAVGMTVSYHVKRTTAAEASKTLRTSRFVQINTAAYGATSLTGPYNLGIPDITVIREIRTKATPFTSANTEGAAVTGLFNVDNGQRDEFYDHATITPKSPLASNTHILVQLDYFEPDYSSGKAYFSIDSYPVNDYDIDVTSEITFAQIPRYKSPISGDVYNLRNYLDFRLVKTRTASDSATIAGASINPATTTSYQSDGSSFRIPAYNRDIQFDYSYYLSRKDVVYVNKDNNFVVKRGNPGSNPITPAVPQECMPLATLTIAPYPSLSPEYGNALNRQDISCSVTPSVNRRYTMKDIDSLRKRIENLEYYSSLSLMEKNAADFQILDANGLNRFKNGIFVDTFKDHTNGAQYNTDYRITVDSFENVLRPIYDQKSLYYYYVSGNANVKLNDNVDFVTLDYTETPFVTQSYATTNRNIETSVYNYRGLMTLNPSDDVYVNTVQLANNNVTQNNVIQQTYNVWQTQVTGYQLVDAVTGKVLRKYYTSQRYTIYAAGVTGRTDWDFAEYNTYYNPWVKDVTGADVGEVATALQMAKFEALLIAGPDAKFNLKWYNGPNISVRVEEISTTTRVGTESFSEVIGENSVSLGNAVIGTSIIKYIRPQSISLTVNGLKPNTKHYIYFAGENMSNYVSPAPYQYPGQIAPQVIYGEGTAPVSDYKGNMFAYLRLPDPSIKPFTTGTKEVEVTDSLTNESDATSYAVANFFAQALEQQVQNTILTTRTVAKYDKQEAFSLNDIVSNRNVYQADAREWSCMAYSFYVDTPPGEEGLFLTSVDVYIEQVDPKLGVWFEVREMNNAGGITRNQVPLSEVWYEPEEVQPYVSSDASVPFNVKFKAPLFLLNGQQYAFVIHTVGINPGTYFFVAETGSTDLGGKGQYNRRAKTGTLYTTNNNLNWSVVADNNFDLKCTFYRAKFVKNVNGQFILGSAPVERLIANTVPTALTQHGEIFVGNDKLTLANISGGIIAATDLLVGSNSGANVAVTSNVGTVYTMANSGFVAGESVVVRYSANAALKGVTANVVSVSHATGKLLTYGDFTQKFVELTDSAGLVFEGDTMRGQQSFQRFTVEKIEKQRYSLVNFQPATLSFASTQATYEMRTISYDGSTVRSYATITEKNNYDFDTEEAIFSKTTERASFSNNASNLVRVTMFTNSEYLSPVVDLGKTHSIYVDNIINNDITGESGPKGGNLINKYISKIVTLAEGQDAEDLNVILTAYRPTGTEVYVWAKVLHAEDNDPFDTKNWIRMEYINNSERYSSLGNSQDYIEYGFRFPNSVVTGFNSSGTLGVLQYTNSAGIQFSGFKYFAVKIGLGSTNSAIVPKVGDLRVIALQL